MANQNNLGIRIVTNVDKSESIKSINRSLQQMQSSLKSLDIDVDFKGFQKDFNKAMKQVDTKPMENKIEKSINSSLDTVRKKNKKLGEEINNVANKYGGSISGIQTNYGKDENDLKGALVTLKDYNSELTRKIRISNELGDYKVVDVQEIENIEKARKAQERLAREQEKTYQQKREELRKNEQQREKQENKEKDFASKYKLWWRDALDERDNKAEKLSKKQKEQADRYEHWWSDALNKREKKEKDLEHTIEQAQRQARLRADKLLTEKSKFISDGQREEIEKYVDSMGRISKNTPNARKAIQDLNMSFKETKGQIDQVANRTMSFTDKMREAISSTAVWASAMTVS